MTVDDNGKIIEQQLVVKNNVLPTRFKLDYCDLDNLRQFIDVETVGFLDADNIQLIDNDGQNLTDADLSDAFSTNFDIDCCSINVGGGFIDADNIQLVDSEGVKLFDVGI